MLPGPGVGVFKPEGGFFSPIGTAQGNFLEITPPIAQLSRTLENVISSQGLSGVYTSFMFGQQFQGQAQGLPRPSADPFSPFQRFESKQFFLTLRLFLCVSSCTCLVLY